MRSTCEAQTNTKPHLFLTQLNLTLLDYVFFLQQLLLLPFKVFFALKGGKKNVLNRVRNQTHVGLIFDTRHINSYLLGKVT